MTSILFNKEPSKQEFNKAIPTIEEKQNKEIEQSFVSNIYYNWFEDMKDISEGKYSGQSRLLNQLYEPYIKGVLDTVPKESQKEVGNVLTKVAEAYEKQDLEKQKQENNYEAIEQNKINIVKSGKMAIESYDSNEPEEVSTIKSSMHMKVLLDNLESGTISPEMFNSLVSDTSKAFIGKELTAILVNDNLSTKAKYKQIQKFLTGNTGEDAVDKYLNPLERIQIVSQVMGITSQTNAYKEKLKAENSEQLKELFDSEYMKTIQYIARSGMRNGEQFKQLQQNLYQYANTPQDIERISNLSDVVLPRTTSTFTTMVINEKKKNGTWNEETYKNYVYDNQLSASDVVKLGEEFLQPANINFKLIDDIDSLARSKTGFSLSNQAGYNDWKARVLADPEFSNTILGQQQARAIAEKHLNETMKSQPVWKEVVREQMNREFNSIGIPYRSATQYLSSSMQEVSDELNIDNPTFEQIQPVLEKKLRENWKYRRDKGIAETITGVDGKPITNPELIIKAQSAIIKKNIYDNWENQ